MSQTEDFYELSIICIFPKGGSALEDWIPRDGSLAQNKISGFCFQLNIAWKSEAPVILKDRENIAMSLTFFRFAILIFEVKWGQQ